jgi:hypothetical protein
MISPRPPTERGSDFREVVIAWLLAAIMLAGPALLSLGVADTPTHTELRRALPISSISGMPGRMEGSDASEMCDADTPGEEWILQCPNGRVAGRGIGWDDSDEVAEC